MGHVHETVRITDQLREAAQDLQHLDDGQITSTDDPLTMMSNLHTVLSILRDTWPALSEAAGFDDATHQEGLSFTEDILRGLTIAAEGLGTARNSI